MPLLALSDAASEPAQPELFLAAAAAAKTPLSKKGRKPPATASGGQPLHTAALVPFEATEPQLAPSFSTAAAAEMAPHPAKPNRKRARAASAGTPTTSDALAIVPVVPGLCQQPAPAAAAAAAAAAEPEPLEPATTPKKKAAKGGANGAKVTPAKEVAKGKGKKQAKAPAPPANKARASPGKRARSVSPNPSSEDAASSTDPAPRTPVTLSSFFQAGAAGADFDVD